MLKMTAWYERYPPTKGKKGCVDVESREDVDETRAGEDVAQLRPSDGE